MSKRVIFTGGSGKAGSHVIPILQERGHKLLNLDRVPLDFPGVNTMITDLADSGQVFNALSTYFSFDEHFASAGRAPVDAIVHFAAIPRILQVPDNTMFATNVLSTYNILEAATKLGIRKVIIASSETVYGICFAEGDRDFQSFPIDENHDADPTDSYGLSKVVGETIARSFASRTGSDIYALRIGAVTLPEDYHRFPANVADPLSRKRDGWSYIDVRDLAEIVHLCIETDGLGFQVFNATNDDIIAEMPTAEFLARHVPQTPTTRLLEGFEAPLTNRKAKEMLGFRETYNWRKIVSDA
ncbi:UDP-glucose 4-epimerase [Kaistia sp. 32K]|uniref:NAD-dependent epimerase/dehydratase family protein n=1 Tax=Kaistia sp. 32K TaxID=2795690 RepID=UPI001915C724|nr:NAD(P)-dependent oxidoreductase [Kaistia sp. 32K]BCP55265.1 UDP-glucose 4-epimerase [Kaistia sp. 32K]